MTSKPTVYAVNMLTIAIILIQLQLATQFLSCAGNPRSAWSIVGFGLRLAKDIKAHRNGSTSTTTADDELEKRALWQVQIHPFLSVVLIHHSRMLLLFDTQLSVALGRASVMDPLKLDLSLPIAFPDESTDKQSTLAFFNCLINLYRILNFTLRSLYTVRLDQFQTNHSPDIPAIIVGLTLHMKFMVEQYERSHSFKYDGESAMISIFIYVMRVLESRQQPVVPYRTLLPPLPPPSPPRLLGALRLLDHPSRVVAPSLKRRPSFDSDEDLMDLDDMQDNGDEDDEPELSLSEGKKRAAPPDGRARKRSRQD
ncbi:hypothetical protein B0H14DRAFT_2564495 [Mycena olivaceomarginata]|nr:hypothetical protein B0H14DRAFT_2564495 [Mycena olivaceomarginata]